MLDETIVNPPKGWNILLGEEFFLEEDQSYVSLEVVSTLANHINFEMFHFGLFREGGKHIQAAKLGIPFILGEDVDVGSQGKFADIIWSRHIPSHLVCPNYGDQNISFDSKRTCTLSLCAGMVMASQSGYLPEKVKDMFNRPNNDLVSLVF